MTNFIAGAMRPVLSCSDLDQLKQLDCHRVLQALGTSPEETLSEEEFILHMTQLIDPDRLPGLAEAKAANGSSAV